MYIGGWYHHRPRRWACRDFTWLWDRSFQTAVEAPSNDLLSLWYRQYQYTDKQVEGQSLDSDVFIRPRLVEAASELIDTSTRIPSLFTEQYPQVHISIFVRYSHNTRLIICMVCSIDHANSSALVGIQDNWKRIGITLHHQTYHAVNNRWQSEMAGPRGVFTRIWKKYLNAQLSPGHLRLWPFRHRFTVLFQYRLMAIPSI